MADAFGNIMRAPGSSSKARIDDPELLYSYNPPPTKKGVTLQPGQGLLLIGTPLIQLTDGSKQFIAAAGGTNAIGFLYRSVDTGASGDVPHQGNIIMGGVLKYALVKAANGGVDIPSGTLTALGGHINTVYGFLKF